MDRHSGDRRANPATQKALEAKSAPPLVGRDEEVRRIARALSLAADGQGRTIFLTGQAGIGKTRLAHEALALAKERGFRTLEGRAYPQESGLAYAPFLDSFGSLLRSLGPARLTDLVSGLPELGRLFGGLQLPPPEPLNDPALEKTRLFEAMLRLLERLTQEAPVALFIDDVNCADPATIELLHYLVRGLIDQQVLLIASYRIDPMDASPRLRAMIGSLLRAGLAEEIILQRLEPNAVASLVRGILDGEAPGALLALLQSRAGGTPLFVEALIRALIESGSLVRSPSPSPAGKNGWAFDSESATDLPPSVRHLIMDRLDRLDPADRRVLNLAAIMGDAASHTLLRAASGLEEEMLLGALWRLQAAGLLVEGIDGPEVTYTFAHPLIQEVAYAEVPEMVRRRYHLAAIKALESFREARSDDLFKISDKDLNRLARHYRSAGPEADPDRALSVLLAAGERASIVYANEEAARHYTAALALLRGGRGTGVGGQETPAPVPRLLSPDIMPWLLEQLGEVWGRVGEGGRAVRLWNEALAEREKAGHSNGRTVALARLRRRLAMAEWDQGHFDVANAHLSAGFAVLAGQDACQELADLHFVRYQILSRRGDATGVAETAAQLLSVAERLGSPRAEAEANLAATLSCLWQNDVNGARERALHALAVAESFSEGQELAICCRIHFALTIIGMRLGDHQFIRHHAEQGLAVAKRLSDPTAEILLSLRLAYADYIAGAWDKSLRCSMEAVVLARRVGHPRDLAYALAERAMILALQSDMPEAEACIREVRTAFGNPSPEGLADRAVFSSIDIAETALALERGQMERALDIARGFTRLSKVSVTHGGLTITYLPMGLMLLAEAQAAAGDVESVLETARKLIDLGPVGNTYVAAMASRAEGLARKTLGQTEVALVCLTRAHGMFSALEMPFEAARTLMELASVGGQGPGYGGLTPAQAAGQSLAIFERLGAQRYADQARRLLRGFGISAPAARRSRVGSCPLSERELEVARLVAADLPTAEIAERLSLSPRTITSHLDHIYARLGIGSRAALTRYVIEAGLL